MCCTVAMRDHQHTHHKRSIGSKTPALMDMLAIKQRYDNLMAFMNGISGHGTVVAGHMVNCEVLAGKQGLLIQGTLFSKLHVCSETVRDWRELKPEQGVLQKGGVEAVAAFVPGRKGKALGAALGAVMTSGHTVQINYVDGKHSVIELPNKLFMVLRAFLGDCQLPSPVQEDSGKELDSTLPGTVERVAGVAQQTVDAFSALIKRNTRVSAASSVVSVAAKSESKEKDVFQAISQLSQLHDSGIITDEEFTSKKSELLKKL
jgi:hypothetical protein